MRWLILLVVLIGALGLPLRSEAQIGIGGGATLRGGVTVGMGASGNRPLPDGPAAPPPAPIPTGSGVRNYFKTDSTSTVSAATLTDEQLVAAAKRGVEYLLAHKAKINWERKNYGVAGSPTQGFDTAAILYCLLQAGDALHDPRLAPTSADIAPALRWLAYLNPPYTDTVGLQLSVLAQVADRPEYKPDLYRVTKILASNLRPDGGFSFWMNSAYAAGWDAPTYSNGLTSQLAMLGMLDAVDAGVPVAPQFWTATDQYWRRAENPDGGWCYGMAGKNSPRDHHRPTEDGSPVDESNMGLSSGGAAVVTMIKQHLPTPDWTADANLSKATNYLGTHFDAHDARCLFQLSYYRSTALDCLELFSQNSGVQKLGTSDMFRELAAALIRSQNADGSWNTPGDQDGTAYAVLFLARGHVPIYIDKLAYDGNWNAHPRDAAGATNVLRQRFERALAWRVVSIHTDPAMWSPASVLWITGHGDPGFSAEDIAKLRTFVQAGGTILSSADANDLAFTAAVRKYATAMTGGQMQDVASTSDMFSANGAVTHYKLQSINDGKRDLWIHSPTDLGALWQTGLAANKEVIALDENIFNHVTGKRELPPPLGATPRPATR